MYSHGFDTLQYNAIMKERAHAHPHNCHITPVHRRHYLHKHQHGGEQGEQEGGGRASKLYSDCSSIGKRLIVYLSTEQEVLLQVLLVLPVLLMAVYIVLVEQGDLYTGSLFYSSKQ